MIYAWQASRGLADLVLVLAWWARGACGQYCDAGFGATECTSVLVVCAAFASFCDDVQSQLRGTGAFATVDTWYASSASYGSGSGTPSLAQLAAYHAILAFSDNNFGDSALMGDRLAAYHDKGGGVVVAEFANYWLRGAYGTLSSGYALLNYGQGTTPAPTDSLGALLEPLSPLMAGVASLAARNAYRSTAPVVDGRGVVVARWAGGGQEPLVVRGRRGNRTLVELNFFPPSSSASSEFLTGDGALLLRNGLKYSRCMACGIGTYAGQGGGGRGRGGGGGRIR
jgi:hypothetical protein